MNDNIKRKDKEIESLKKEATALSKNPFRSILNDQNNKENQHFYQIDSNNNIELSKLNKQINELKANERKLNEKIIIKDSEIETLKKEKNIRSMNSQPTQQPFSLLSNFSTNDTICKENQELKKKIEHLLLFWKQYQSFYQT